jgi:type II secretory ATPase GspE/PulE/Tfp pilus assembly ATPase PilB-like protein
MSDSLPIPIEHFHWSELDLEQTFRLVEKYIPFEVCRTYEIIPLKFQNHRLTLGIVDLESPTVHIVLKKLLARKRFTLLGQQLDTKTYQLILSSYQNYKKTSTIPAINETIPPSPSAEDHPPEIPFSEKATFVMNEDALPQYPATQSEQQSAPPSLADDDDDKKTVIFEGDLTELQVAPKAAAKPINLPQGKESLKKNRIPSILVPNAPVKFHDSENRQKHNEQRLNVQSQFSQKPLDSLAELPANQLWHELLGRVLADGIGRLYFENHEREGRILLSENGVMKGVLFGLPIDKFYGVLNEFKHLAHILPEPVVQTQKVELEQYYRNERILLRLTVVPGKYGDEGTLQVLRGHALVFHQQKQMDEQGQDALQLAKKLERKLRHIHLRSQINPSPLTVLDELIACCDRLQIQLNKIQPRG